MRANHPIIIVICLRLTIGAISAAEEGVPLRLAEAIALALDNNLDIAIQQELVVVAEAGVIEAAGAFDPSFSAGLTRSEDQRTLNAESSAAAAGLTRVRTESENASVGVSGLTPASTRYNLSAQNRNASDTFNNFEKEHVSSASLTLTQPLLRGRGTTYTTHGMHLARRNVTISKLDFQLQVEGILLQVEQAYWDLLRADRDRAVRRKSVEAAASLLGQVNIKVEVGTASEADRVQAQSGLAQRRLSLIAAERTHQLQERNVKNLIVKDLARAPVGFLPLDEPSTNRIVSAQADVLADALALRPEMLRSELDRLTAEEQLRRLKNEALPQVDLEGNYGVNGLGGSFSDAADNAAARDDNNWSLGLVYRRAWPDRQRQGALRRQQSVVRRQALQFQQTRRKIEAEIEGLFDQLNGALDEIRAGALAMQFAQLNLDNERAKFEVQKSTVHNMLLLEAELLEAELSQVRARAEFQKILAELDRAQGRLLERWGIALEAGGPAIR
jgi:outer membrane protein TolC